MFKIIFTFLAVFTLTAHAATSEELGAIKLGDAPEYIQNSKFTLNRDLVFNLDDRGYDLEKVIYSAGSPINPWASSNTCKMTINSVDLAVASLPSVNNLTFKKGTLLEIGGFKNYFNMGDIFKGSETVTVASITATSNGRHLNLMLYCTRHPARGDDQFSDLSHGLEKLGITGNFKAPRLEHTQFGGAQAEAQPAGGAR